MKKRETNASHKTFELALRINFHQRRRRAHINQRIENFVEFARSLQRRRISAASLFKETQQVAIVRKKTLTLLCWSAVNKMEYDGRCFPLADVHCHGQIKPYARGNSRRHRPLSYSLRIPFISKASAWPHHLLISEKTMDAWWVFIGENSCTEAGLFLFLTFWYGASNGINIQRVPYLEQNIWHLWQL